MAETTPRRPRNILMDEFPTAGKEACSQALRDTMGDMDAARALLRRGPDDTDDDEPPPEDPPSDVEDPPSDVDVKAEDEDTDGYEGAPPPPSDEDEDGYDSEAFDREMARMYPKRKRAPREKLSDEEKARRKAARKAKSDAAKAERARAAAREKETVKANRERLLSGGGGASAKLAPYKGVSGFRGAVGERPNWTDAKLLYVRSVKVKESDYGEKYQLLHTFIVDDRDVVQWWASAKTEERKLFSEGCVASFAGTVKKHSNWEGVDITTVVRVKAHVVDGAKLVDRIPKAKPPPGGAPFSGAGRKANDSDSEDEVVMSPPKKSPAKPRVKGGAKAQAAKHKRLVAEDPTAPEPYENMRDQRAAEGNSFLKDLARQRAERALAKKK